MVIQRAGNVSSSAYLGLYEWRSGGGEEKGRSWWCSDGEVERAVGADGDEAWDRRAGYVGCCSGVELLFCGLVLGAASSDVLKACARKSILYSSRV